jgi:predicted amidohydrolase
MKIALAQMQMSQDIESNYQKSLCFIREAAEKGAQLVMFPEIQLTPFFPQYENEDASDYVITFNHPYVKGICDVCRKNRIFLLRTFTLKKMGRDMI